MVFWSSQALSLSGHVLISLTSLCIVYYYYKCIYYVHQYYEANYCGAVSIAGLC